MPKRAVSYQHYTPWDCYVHDTAGNSECPCGPEVHDVMSAEVGLVARLFDHKRCDQEGKPIPDDVTVFSEVYLACDGCNGRVAGTKPKRMGSVNWPCLCPHGAHPVVVAPLEGRPGSGTVPPESAAGV